jgi:hypothetical protein
VTLGEIARLIAGSQPPSNEPPSGNTLEDKAANALDKQYTYSNKKHRNWIANFDHWFEMISHPFTLVVIFALVFLVFLAARYWAAFSPGHLAPQIAKDSGTALSYLGTIVVTSVFTKFLERRKKQ